MVALVIQVHEQHNTHGYRWTSAYICINTPYTIDDNYQCPR